MRSVDSDLLDALVGSRKVGARFTIRDNRLLFDARTIVDTLTLENDYDWDVSQMGESLLECAKTAANQLAYRFVADPSDTDWGAWEFVLDSDGDTLIIDSDCAPGVEGGRIWFVDDDTSLGPDSDDLRSVYYVDYDTGTGIGTPVAVGDTCLTGLPSMEISLAPVCDSICYIQSGPATSPLIHSELLAVNDIGVVVTRFHGYVYGNATQRYKFDAVRFDSDYDYVFVVDEDNGRTLVSRVCGQIWSDLDYLVHIDIVDQDNNFVFSGVSLIDNQIWATGRYSRGEFVAFDMYTRGSDHWTMSRDVFITQTAIYGKMFLCSNVMYYVGHGNVAEAPASMLVDYDNADNKTQTTKIIGLNTRFRANRASSLTAELSNELDTDDNIRRNAEITVEVEIDTLYAQLGVFGIDVISPADDEQGEVFNVGGRGIGAKRLDQWESDQNYDWWSQTKLFSDDIVGGGQLAPTTGTWIQDSDVSTTDPIGLVDELNVEGYKYTVCKPGRGGAMRARFQVPQGNDTDLSWECKCGVGLNYYRETRYEAALRLDTDAEGITESRFGHNGIFAYFDMATDGDIDDIKVVRIEDGTETEIASFDAGTYDNWIAGEWKWISILFQDGWIGVYTKNDTVDDWDTIGEVRYAEDGEPWFRDDIGRGAIFILNTTPYSWTPGFNSKSTIIPVEDASVFPESGKVIVDDELITYNRKKVFTDTDCDTLCEGVTYGWTEGYTHQQSPVINNDDSDVGWVDILIRETGWDTDAAGTAKIGYNHTSELQHLAYSFKCWFEGQSLRAGGNNPGEHYGIMQLNKIRVPLRAVGNPERPIYCYIVWDNWDNETPPPVAAYHYCCGPLDTDDISDTFAWVTFDCNLDENGAPRDGADRWLDADPGPGPEFQDMYYWKAWYVNLTCVPPGDTDPSAYEDATDYYEVKLNNTCYEKIGILRRWTDDGVWEYWSQSHDNASLPLEIYGQHALAWQGYEMYAYDVDDTGGSSAMENDPSLETDLALVCIEGSGKGWVSRIIYYDDMAPKQWIPNQEYEEPDRWQDHVGDTEHGAWDGGDPGLKRFYTEDRPVGFDETSRFKVYESLIVANRGVDDTVATAHGHTLVSIYSPHKVRCDRAIYTTSNMDMRLEDMAREIATKAGVMEFAAEKDCDSDIVFDTDWDEQVYDGHRHAIIKFDMPVLDSDEEIGCIFRLDTDGDFVQGYKLTVDTEPVLKFYRFDTGDSDFALIETFPVPISPGGEITMSAWEGYFSVWFNSRYIFTFCDTMWETGNWAGICAKGTVTVAADVSALDRRVDNFILDMGSRGTQLIQGLFGQNRVLWQDTQTGGLKIARLKTDAGADYALSDILVGAGESVMDQDQKTIIRAEGIEALEIVDYTELKNYGFLFGMFNAPTANDDWETQIEAEAIRDDLKSSARTSSFRSVGDPRIEPNDALTVILPDGASVIIVDGVIYRLTQSEESVDWSMQVDGRYAI